jgi:hypothetical protein
LPIIAEDDIHLICWMAVASEGVTEAKEPEGELADLFAPEQQTLA